MRCDGAWGWGGRVQVQERVSWGALELGLGGRAGATSVQGG